MGQFRAAFSGMRDGFAVLFVEGGIRHGAVPLGLFLFHRFDTRR